MPRSSSNKALSPPGGWLIDAIRHAHSSCLYLESDSTVRQSAPYMLSRCAVSYVIASGETRRHSANELRPSGVSLETPHCPLKTTATLSDWTFNRILNSDQHTHSSLFTVPHKTAD